MIAIKRIYEEPKAEDGYRVLVDRLWPRGVSREKAKLDLWCKELAPGAALRKWFGHEAQKWAEFKDKYKLELEEKALFLSKLKTLEREQGKITLLYAARTPSHNHALVLQEVLKGR